MRLTSILTITTAGLLCAGSLHGQIVATFEEGVDLADFSSNAAAPTSVAFEAGVNRVIGTVTASGGADVRDYFTFDVGPGQFLTDIRVVSYETFSGGSSTPDPVANTAFAHIDEGTTSVVPAGGTINDFIGGAHINNTATPATINFLETLAGAPQGGTGFTAPLGEGAYTFNIQQTGPQLSAYTLDFTISDVPEPSTYAAIFGVVALAGVVVRRRLRARKAA
ncbi:MAG: PEP-CTERM sorting domain-containing protein [Opitutales bacterium]